MKLDVKAFALTSGLVWGIGLFLVTLWIVALEGPPASNAKPPFLGLIYRGYTLSIPGSFFGLAWGLVDGAIGGAVFAWLYNRLSARSRAAGSAFPP